MIRLILALAFIAAAAVAAAWLAENPGHIVMDWRDYRIETSLALLAVAAAVLAAVAVLIYRLLATAFGLPDHLRRRWRDQQHRRGLTALSRGLTAMAAGDGPETEKQARRAGRLLDQPSLALLLSAQAAGLKGDEDAAHAYYAALAGREDSRFLGLRGLARVAERRGDWAAARQALDQAAQIRPKAAWVIEGLINLTARETDWPALIKILDRAKRAKSLPAEDIKRRSAAAWTAQAEALQRSGDSSAALTAARRAVKIDPAFAPAAALTAGLLIGQGGHRRAAALIKRAWTARPHRLLAAAHRRLIADQDPIARVQQTDRLAALAPDDRESHLARAQTALEADLWGKARDHLAHAAPDGPTRETCLMMAEIERREHGDGDAARKWLRRAGSAPPDSAWACGDCAARWDDWSPRCGACGGFAALQWREAGRTPPPRLSAPEPLAALPGRQTPHQQSAHPPPAPAAATATPPAARGNMA